MLKVKPPTVIPVVRRFVVVDGPKLAVPVGTVPVDQLAAVLRSLEPGLASQVASCARAVFAAWQATHINTATRVEA